MTKNQSDQNPYQETYGQTLTADPETELSEPPMYVVIMHNDDYTPMDFVVSILIDIFRRKPEEANKIMLEVHNKGFGRCGTYPRDIAETKAGLANSTAKTNGHPLKCTVERENNDQPRT